MRTTRWASAVIARNLVASLVLTTSVCLGQTVIPDRLPELHYPPIAIAARVQGDVAVSFKQAPDGSTVEVMPISGPKMLQSVAVENVKAWHFAPSTKPAGEIYKAIFHFQLNPPDDSFDENQQTTKVELDGAGGVHVISILTTGLQRRRCPSAAERELPSGVIEGDYVELERWNEIVKVGADGLVSWKYGKELRTGRISAAEAKLLLEQFRTQRVWNLCESYYEAGLLDGGSSSFKALIGGREKNVSEYGDVAPPIFREIEDLVDAVANTHQWRHGNPSTESIVEISYEHLPKPGKTRLMDAALEGSDVRYRSALIGGDKLTDVDSSGWTPLMYAAGSYGNSEEKEILKAGVDVNARSKRGETALMASAVTGMADEYLLNAGANVNAVNDVGMTALMLLAQRGDPAEISIFLKAGADAQKKDSMGRTALDYLNAANCGDPVVQAKDPQWMTLGYSRCNALDHEEFQKSRRLLVKAGARATRSLSPEKLPMGAGK